MTEPSSSTSPRKAGETALTAPRSQDGSTAHTTRGREEDLPPLPTDLEAWHATVRLHRTPSYLRSLADDMERRLNGDRPTPSEKSISDLFAEYANPSPEQIRRRVDRLRVESARLAHLADEIEARL